MSSDRYKYQRMSQTENTCELRHWWARASSASRESCSHNNVIRLPRAQVGKCACHSNNCVACICTTWLRDCVSGVSTCSGNRIPRNGDGSWSDVPNTDDGRHGQCCQSKWISNMSQKLKLRLKQCKFCKCTLLAHNLNYVVESEAKSNPSKFTCCSGDINSTAAEVAVGCCFHCVDTEGVSSARAKAWDGDTGSVHVVDNHAIIGVGHNVGDSTDNHRPRDIDREVVAWSSDVWRSGGFCKKVRLFNSFCR